MGYTIRILSDHKNLEYWQTKNDLNLRQAHWGEQLANYDFTITFIYLFIYTSYSLATVGLWRRLQIMVHCQVPEFYVCYLPGYAPERSFVLGL
jgi:hypothetical protein